ncbi:MAG: hypothetical protein LQ341_005537, partial [Variospora aurantia]
PLSNQLDSLLFLQLLYHLALSSLALLVVASDSLRERDICRLQRDFAAGIQPDHRRIALMVLSRKVQTKLCFPYPSQSRDGHHILSFGGRRQAFVETSKLVLSSDEELLIDLRCIFKI